MKISQVQFSNPPLEGGPSSNGNGQLVTHPPDRFDLLDWLLPHCEPDHVALLYPKARKGASPGWVKNGEDATRAISAYRNGTLTNEVFESITQKGKEYTIRKPSQLGLVAHRGGQVHIFCIDLDDHTGDGGNVHLLRVPNKKPSPFGRGLGEGMYFASEHPNIPHPRPLSRWERGVGRFNLLGVLNTVERFFNARAVAFTSRRGMGIHCFFQLIEPLEVRRFISWEKAWGFNRKDDIELFPKSAKLSQMWLPNEPNECGGDTYVSGTFESCQVQSLPEEPSVNLTNNTLYFLRGFIAQPGRNDALNKAAFELGRKRMHFDEAWRLCQRGAQLCGLELEEPDQTRTTFDSGYNAGLSQSPSSVRLTKCIVPEIVIDVDEHRVIDEAIHALSADPDLYKRGEVLVRVIETTGFGIGVESVSTLVIKQVPKANLRDRLTRHVRLVGYDKKGELIPKHPPDWLVGGIDARCEWKGVRELLAITNAPILRPDGTILQQPGYDDATAVLYVPHKEFPTIHDEVGLDDAQVALDELLEVIADFSFECEAHKSVWIAALLTAIARYAFTGPTPLILIDANIRGAGKGLLAKIIGQIVLGEELPVTTFSSDENEMRKHITALAISGDRIILLDNLNGEFGNAAIDRALTTTRWKDRILGKSDEADMPLMSLWIATGNNVLVKADTLRRVLHLRLDVLNEHPELRTDFKHPDLLSYVTKERERLYVAALTILRAYVRSGRPKMFIQPFGSFEGWSDLVRNAVIWVGMPDPCETRVALEASADTVGRNLEQLIDAWIAWVPEGHGVTLAEIVRKVFGDAQLPLEDHQSAEALRNALDELLDLPQGRTPTVKQIGSRLRHYRRRPSKGWFLDIDNSKKSRRGAIWRLFRAEGGS